MGRRCVVGSSLVMLLYNTFVQICFAFLFASCGFGRDGLKPTDYLQRKVEVADIFRLCILFVLQVIRYTVSLRLGLFGRIG